MNIPCKKGVSGIYCIRNVITEEEYIGASVDVYSRILEHASRLNKGIHNNIHLLESWELYGGNAFISELIEEVVPALFPEREQFYISSRNASFNIQKEIGKISEETKAKMRAAYLERKPPQNKGRIRSIKTKEKMSRAQRSLTEAQVTQIMELYSNGYSQKDIAAQFQRSPRVINRVVRGKYGVVR